MSCQQSFRNTAKLRLDTAVHVARSIAARQDGASPAYERILHHVRKRTSLLQPQASAGRGRFPAPLTIHCGLLALALHHADWLRPVESWNPQSQSAWPQFTSLTHHLLARYPVPTFMTSVWFDLPPGHVLPQHDWYKHLGIGKSIRTARLPLRFTRKMAHWFSQAPNHR
jgi:hypothetical protein